MMRRTSMLAGVVTMVLGAAIKADEAIVVLNGTTDAAAE